jgi:hypothetical protein
LKVESFTKEEPACFKFLARFVIKIDFISGDVAMPSISFSPIYGIPK